MSAVTDDSSIQEEFDAPRSHEIAARLPPGPAILWGILLSEGTDLGSCEVLDVDTIIELWLAAGYHCPLLLEDEIKPTDIDTAPVDHEDSAQHPQFHELSEPIDSYVIKESPGKGQGVFAARDLSRGERVLVDTPFFVVTKPYNYHQVLQQFEGLSFANRQQYMRLSCPDRSDNIQLTDVMRIFEANCFNIGESAAIFLQATRFNHSCLPNTYYSWSEARREVIFHSMVPIPQGEEMTICYGRPFLTRLERRSELRIYNFQCLCPACRPDTAFGQASEARRLAMRGLEEQIIMFQSMLDQALLSYGLRDPLMAILRLIELVKEEGLQGELMTPYRNAADHLKLVGRFGEALGFVRLEMEEELVCLGKDSEVVVRTGVYIDELEMMAKGEVEDVRTLGLAEKRVSGDWKRGVAVVETDAVTRGLEETSEIVPAAERKRDEVEGDAETHGATASSVPRHAGSLIVDPASETRKEPAELDLATRTPHHGINELTYSLDEAVPSHRSSFDDGVDDGKVDFIDSDPTSRDHPFSSQSSSPRLVREK